MEEGAPRTPHKTEYKEDPDAKRLNERLERARIAYEEAEAVRLRRKPKSDDAVAKEEAEKKRG